VCDDFPHTHVCWRCYKRLEEEQGADFDIYRASGVTGTDNSNNNNESDGGDGGTEGDDESGGGNDESGGGNNGSSRNATGTTRSGMNLSSIRSSMNLTNIKSKTRAKATYNKHQLENERFILWLYNHEQHCNLCLAHDLVEKLDDLKASVVVPANMKKRWRKLSEEDKAIRAKGYEESILRGHIKECLGAAGHPPDGPTVLFDGTTAEVFAEYLCAKRKHNGCLLRPGGYKGMRAGLSYLFRRYGQKQTDDFKENVGEYLKGVKRVANEARQAGEGNIEDGKRELSFPLYTKFNEWCVQDGTPEGFFARAFSVHCWNLACRGDSTGKILVKHLLWRADSTGIPFAHSKEAQEGDDRRKRRPRHVYANPLHWQADYMSATFEYFVCHPEVLNDPNGAVFPGTEDGLTKRFSAQMDVILKRHEEELKNIFGYEIDDIGVHSWRKGAHTFMNSGSTAGPSAAATCIRGGHTMGAVRDIYVLHEKAGDHYCGRILAGLPVNDAKFAVSHPDFVPVEDGMSEEELARKKAEVDLEVLKVLYEIFGHDQLDKIPTMPPFLKIGLASHLQHRDRLDQEYPPESRIRVTPLYTSIACRNLKRYVKITLPWEKGGKAYATGIPPHTMLLAGNEEIKILLKSLLPEIEKLMDDRTMMGNLSENRMRNIVTDESSALRQELREVRSLLEQEKARHNQGQQQRGAADNTFTAQDKYKRWMVKGFFRRVPADWIFPMGPVLNVYQYWHHGDEQREISPLKKMTRSDLSWATADKKRYPKNLEEVRHIMKMLDTAASEKGLLKDNPTREDTIAAYYGAKHVFGLPEMTPKGRKRNWSKLSWSSVERLMSKEIKKRKTS
jgi:hypothetical protein